MPRRMAGSDPVMATLQGLNLASGGVFSKFDPSAIAGTVAQFGYEALPGNQKTALDYNPVQRTISAGHDTYHGKNPVDVGITDATHVAASNLREKTAESIGRMGIGAAGSKLAAIGSKALAGTVASGGALALPMTIYGAGETLNLGSELLTGRSILDHAENPNYIRGRSGAKRAMI